MNIYVIMEWDCGERHLEGNAFIDKKNADKYCKDNEFLEVEEVPVTDSQVMFAGTPTGENHFYDIYREFKNKRYPRE